MNGISWRRVAGIALMLVGAAASIAVAALAALILMRQPGAVMPALRYGGVTATAGLILLVVGRITYGDWNGAAPLAGAASTAIRAIGIVVALMLGAMLVILIAAGLKPDDLPAAALLTTGLIAGIALIVVSVMIKARNRRRYLD